MLNSDFSCNIFYVICKFKLKNAKISFFKFLQGLLDVLRCCWSFFLGEEECLCCGLNSGIIPICRNCLQRKGQSSVERCFVCGKELVSEISICSSCRRKKILENVDFVYPLYGYRLWNKNLLFYWKYENIRTLSPVFASIVYEKIKEISSGETCLLPVVPVPPRPGKIRQKGWDQINELCFYLHNMHGIKIFPFLRRMTCIQQKKLDKKHRLEQTSKTFVLRPQNKIKRFLKKLPETVVLVDDVMTTGSTVEACAAELKRAGIKKVAVVTLFIAD